MTQFSTRSSACQPRFNDTALPTKMGIHGRRQWVEAKGISGMRFSALAVCVALLSACSSMPAVTGNSNPHHIKPPSVAGSETTAPQPSEALQSPQQAVVSNDSLAKDPLASIPLPAALATPIPPASSIPRAQAKTTDFTLPNGLKIIVREDHRAPVVMAQMWYKVGSSDENGDETGLSHALEHMMFKGTPTVPGSEFARINAQFGGENNAFTTDEYTGYYQLYPANRLSLALELEADRMQHLVLKPSDFEKEIRVVMEERRQRTDDNPKALAYERFRMMAYPTSPLRYPVIGHMKSLERLKVDALKRWYHQWYTPNNATLVVVGDVTPQQVLAEATRFFGKIPSRPVPPRPDVDEFLHSGERVMNLFFPVQVPVLYMAWNVPSLKTAQDPRDAYALALLQAVLDGGQSARLEQRLTRQQRLVTAISSSYDLYTRGGSLWMISAVPDQGKTLAEARKAILAEVDKLKSDPITAEEIQRVKTAYLADLIYGMDSISGQAQMIGSLESAGLDYRIMDELPAKIDELSIPFIQSVARRYLTMDSLSTLYLAPESLLKKSPAPPVEPVATPARPAPVIQPTPEAPINTPDNSPPESNPKSVPASPNSLSTLAPAGSPSSNPPQKSVTGATP